MKDLVKAPGWFVILRDLVTLGLGAFIIVHQTLNNFQNYPLLGVASLLLGIPGAANLLWVVRNSDTAQQLPPSPLPESSTDSTI